MQELRFSKYPVSEVSKDATEQDAETDRPSNVDHLAGEDDQACGDDQREDREEDGRVGCDIERGAAICRVIETK